MRARQTVTHLTAEQLQANPANIRDDLGDLTDLAASIREHGILQPLTATERGDGYVLLAGHRRLAAGLQAGLTAFPVIIRHDLSDQAEQVIVMLVENTQRRDLNAVERAQAYGALVNRGLSQTEIARRVGTRPSQVNYYLSLLDLDDESLEAVREGRIAADSAVQAVREARQAQRIANGKAARGTAAKVVRNKPVAYFGLAHRLAPVVRRICVHHDRPKVGLVGCGPCWERAIREEEVVVEPTVEAVHDVDEVLVDLILGGEWHRVRETNPAEKREIAVRFFRRGGTTYDLVKLTGWKPERYAHLADAEERAS